LETSTVDIFKPSVLARAVARGCMATWDQTYPVDTPYEMSNGVLLVDSMQSIYMTLSLCLTMLETSRWITRYGVGECSTTRLTVELCVRRLCCCADSVTRVRTRATRATVWVAPDFLPVQNFNHPISIHRL